MDDATRDTFVAAGELLDLALDRVPAAHRAGVSDAALVAVSHAIATIRRGGVTVESVEALASDAVDAALAFVPATIEIDGQSIPTAGAVAMLRSGLEYAVKAIVDAARPKAAAVRAPKATIIIRRHVIDPDDPEVPW